MGSWYIQSNLYKSFLNWNKIFKKNKVVIGKTPFFVIGAFHPPHTFCIALAFDKAVLYENVVVSVVPTKKWSPSFFEKDFRPSENLFQIWSIGNFHSFQWLPHRNMPSLNQYNPMALLFWFLIWFFKHPHFHWGGQGGPGTTNFLTTRFFYY